MSVKLIEFGPLSSNVGSYPDIASVGSVGTEQDARCRSLRFLRSLLDWHICAAWSVRGCSAQSVSFPS
jgi:hypothetical protein